MDLPKMELDKLTPEQRAWVERYQAEAREQWLAGNERRLKELEGRKWRVMRGRDWYAGRGGPTDRQIGIMVLLVFTLMPLAWIVVLGLAGLGLGK